MSVKNGWICEKTQVLPFSAYSLQVLPDGKISKGTSDVPKVIEGVPVHSMPSRERELCIHAADPCY